MQGALHSVEGVDHLTVTLHNPTRSIAFFERVEGTDDKDGTEILPITYDNNYVTVFPGETVTISGQFSHAAASAARPWLRLEGYNTEKQLAPLTKVK